MRHVTISLLMIVALTLSACVIPVPQSPAAPAGEVPAAEEAAAQPTEAVDEEETGEATEAATEEEQAAELTLTTATSDEYGEYIATSDRPVYMFTPDSADESTCYGECANAWPPVTVESLDNVQVGEALDSSLLGTLTREDGATQLVYNGHPLYYFVQDEGADAPQGQEIESFGGEWYLLTPQGTELEGAEEAQQEEAEEEQAMTPSVTVNDQALENGTVTVEQVVSQGPGWIVIHADENGAPGPVIGHAAVEDGMNENVTVEIDTSMATETLYAMLHMDAGEVGTYEFPGADGPVSVDGEVVAPAFTLTDMNEAAATDADTAANEVEVGLVEWDINMPSEISAGEITFVVSNNGTVAHNFEIENEEMGLERVFDQNLEPGETKTMTVDLAPGEYYVYCPIGNHAAQGMELTLTVTEQ